MRQHLHKRAPTDAKTCRNASAPAQTSTHGRKNNPKCVSTCTNEHPRTQKRPEMRQRLHKRAATDAKTARNASAPAQASIHGRKNGLKCVSTCTNKQPWTQKQAETREHLHKQVTKESFRVYFTRAVQIAKPNIAELPNEVAPNCQTKLRQIAK